MVTSSAQRLYSQQVVVGTQTQSCLIPKAELSRPPHCAQVVASPFLRTTAQPPSTWPQKWLGLPLMEQEQAKALAALSQPGRDP